MQRRCSVSVSSRFAASHKARTRLATERRVLRLLEARCRFRAPRILFEDSSGDFDVRAMVPGSADAAWLVTEVRGNVEVARRIGTAIGEILAEQHSSIHDADVHGWLPRRPDWPESWDWIRERLIHVANDETLISDAEAIMVSYDAAPVSEADRALIHADLGFHNLAIDAASYAVLGVFDYKAAAWADGHHDFRYLIVDLGRYELLDAAISAYEAGTGRAIHRERVLLYNAACAITFLAYRAGTSPAERSCGRALEEDLRWSRGAIAQAKGWRA